MSGFSNSVVGGIGNLIRDWIQSVPFVSGSQGWRISRNGDAEFNNATFRGSIIITSGKDLLVYSTNPPATNKLILALAGSAGNDAFGNAWQVGLNVYDAAGFNIGNWDPTKGFTITNDVSAGQLQILPTNTGTKSPRLYLYTGQSGISSTNGFLEAGNSGSKDNFYVVGPQTALDTQQSYVFLDLIGGIPGTPGSATGEFIWAGNSTLVDLGQWDNNGFHIYRGDINAVHPGTSNPPIAETWQNPVLQTGWASGSNSGGMQQLRYRLLPTNEVELQGVIHSTSTTPASVMFILPTGYTPPSTVQRMGIIINKGGGVIAADIVDFHPGGNVQLGINATAIGNDVHFEHIFSLDP